MNLLAIETSSTVCSLAVLVNGKMYSEHRSAPRQQTDLILPLLQDLLKQAGVTVQDLDAIAFGRGPGAFTGVRLGCGVAQGLALGADLPLLGALSLEILAQGAYRQTGTEHIITAIDARMGQVYIAAFKVSDTQLQCLMPAAVCDPDKVDFSTLNAALNSEQWLGAGSGFSVYDEALQGCLQQPLSQLQPELEPNAIDLLTLAQGQFWQQQFLTLEQAVPVYVRDNVAHKSTKG